MKVVIMMIENSERFGWGIYIAKRGFGEPLKIFDTGIEAVEYCNENSYEIVTEIED